MPEAIATGGTRYGVDAARVDICVTIRPGLPSLVVLGLPEVPAKEVKTRVRSALTMLDIELPVAEITVELSPPDLRKDGAALDLPVALALLAALGKLPAEKLAGVLPAGELSLGGELQPIRAAVGFAELAKRLGRTLILPAARLREASLVPGVEARGAWRLRQVVDYLRGEDTLLAAEAPPPMGEAMALDLSDISGMEIPKRALEIAAAGGHHLLLVGPPGSGKCMLAKRLTGILPPMTPEERLEIGRIYSSVGLSEGAVPIWRPFRAPHHTISETGLFGGGAFFHPGELSLAHRGVLLLDELPEFRRPVLEAIPPALERGSVGLYRGGEVYPMPAIPQLVGSMDDCPCGKFGVPNQRCTCAEVTRGRHRKQAEILLPAFDLLARVPAPALRPRPGGESSASVRARVLAARALLPRVEPVHEPFSPDVEALLTVARERRPLSPRATTSVRKVARTIAALAGSPRVEVAHLAEAIQFAPVLE